VLVLRAATGSGKSTALPEALYPRGRRIGITQPARITAEEIPHEIAARNPEFRMGETIGFQTSLINIVPPRGLVFMTTGILVRQLMNQIAREPERFMRRYSTIIVDEVHKHDLMTDVLLRLLKQFLAKFWNHPDCPFVIVQSATLEPEKYMSYFETTQFVDVAGTSYPIKEHWPEQSVGDLKSWIVKTCAKLKGDTAIFLPTKKSITAIKIELEKSKVQIVEVMSETVAKGEVKQMMRESRKPRIVLGTNAMETGLTLPFLANVIDTGLVNSVAYNPQYSCTTIATQPVTEASARQRKGRVGRKFEGNWYPAFTKETYERMVKANPPEMYTSDIAAYLLQVIVTLTESVLDEQWQVESRVEFDPATIGLIHDPSQESLTAAYDKLYQLGFIKTNWRPTVSGLLASRLVMTPPETNKMLLSAAYYRADLYKLIIIAACLEKGGMGDLKGFGNDLHDDRVRCGFIRQLVAYEQLQRRIRKMTVEKLSTTWISEWCEEVGIGYLNALRIIERVYSLMFELMELGLRVDTDRIPLIDTLEQGKKDETLAELTALKSCIYEGYRLNACTWNDLLGSYVCGYKHAKVSCREKFAEGPPLNIVADAITYSRGMTGRMDFSTGRIICQLDEHIVVDPHFMY
jgi:ATP-dependent RNA helicase DHR2